MNRYIYERIRKDRDIQNKDFRTDIGILSGRIGIIINIILTVFKLFIGLSIGSIAITADGVNNGFDTLSSLVTVIGFKFASKPPDKRHPYGHGRVEYVASMIVSILVIIVGIQFMYSSVDHIINPNKIKFDSIFLITMLGSVIIKLWLYNFNKYMGEKINSTVLLATAFDSMADAATTAVVIIPMVSVLFTDFNPDGYIGLLVSIIIIYNGFNFLKMSLNPLIGESPSQELLEKLMEELSIYPIIENPHDIVYEDRGGSQTLLVVSVEMPANMNLKSVHKVIDRVERNFFNKYGVNLVIHPEPRGHLTEEQLKMLNKIDHALDDIDRVLGFTDFMILDNKREILIDIEIEANDENTDLYLLETEILNRLKSLSDYHWDVRFFIGI